METWFRVMRWLNAVHGMARAFGCSPQEAARVLESLRRAAAIR